MNTCPAMGPGRVAPRVAHCPCNASLGIAALPSTIDSYEDVTNIGESGNTTSGAYCLTNTFRQHS